MQDLRVGNALAVGMITMGRLRVLDAFTAEATEAKTIDALRETLSRISRELGFDYFALAEFHALSSRAAAAAMSCRVNRLRRAIAARYQSTSPNSSVTASAYPR